MTTRTDLNVIGTISKQLGRVIPLVPLTELHASQLAFCADGEMVQALSLRGCGLRKVPEAVWELTSLQALSLGENEFETLSTPYWVSVSDIYKLDQAILLQKAGITSFEDPLFRKYSERIQRVKNIENYLYSMHILDSTMSYEEATEIFVRVNSLGVKLRSSDLALAQISSKWPGFIQLMEDYVSEFDNDADFLFDWILVRLTTIFATKQSRFKTIGRIPKPKLEKAWKRAKDGLTYSVNFLRNNAKLESLSFLSAAFLIIPIAVYAELHNGELNVSEEKKLLRWFYFAHLRGHYSVGSSETVLDSDLSVLFNNKGLDALFDNLEKHVNKTYLDIEDIRGRGIRSPVFTMLYFVLRHNGAKDWISGLQMSEKVLGDANKIENHHIFPKSLLSKHGIGTKEINEIANIAFIGGKTNRRILDKEPSKYFEKDIIPKRGEEALTSQLVPLDRELWKIKNYDKFLNYRRNESVKSINHFLKQYD
ncbi:MAG: hypothetical protein WD740_05035 [Anaerolineales bacterium]